MSVLAGAHPLERDDEANERRVEGVEMLARQSALVGTCDRVVEDDIIEARDPKIDVITQK